MTADHGKILADDILALRDACERARCHREDRDAALREAKSEIERLRAALAEVLVDMDTLAGMAGMGVDGLHHYGGVYFDCRKRLRQALESKRAT